MTWIPSFTAVAALLLATGVSLGAAGAHAVPAATVSIWNKAVLYQLFHGLGIISIQLLSSTGHVSRTHGALVSFTMTLGTLCFCIPLYIRCLSDSTQLTKVAPAGGTLMIVSWLLLALFTWSR